MDRRTAVIPGTAHPHERGAAIDFVSIADWSRPKLEEVLRLAGAIKVNPEPHKEKAILLTLIR